MSPSDHYQELNIKCLIYSDKKSFLHYEFVLLPQLFLKEENEMLYFNSFIPKITMTRYFRKNLK